MTITFHLNCHCFIHRLSFKFRKKEEVIADIFGSGSERARFCSWIFGLPHLRRCKEKCHKYFYSSSSVDKKILETKPNVGERNVAGLSILNCSKKRRIKRQTKAKQGGKVRRQRIVRARGFSNALLFCDVWWKPCSEDFLRIGCGFLRLGVGGWTRLVLRCMGWP